jgi:hypothetical protein
LTHEAQVCGHGPGGSAGACRGMSRRAMPVVTVRGGGRRRYRHRHGRGAQRAGDRAKCGSGGHGRADLNRPLVGRLRACTGRPAAAAAATPSQQHSQRGSR